MKLITTLTAASLLALTACGQGAPDIKTPASVNDMASKTSEMTNKAKSAAQMATKTKAVLIYADWCGSCKVLDPKIKAVQSTLGGGAALPGLEFITLDYTDKNAENFYAQAEAAGVGPAVKAYLDGTVKTGQLLLVDVDDQAVVGTVNKTLEPAQIMTALKDAVSAS